MYPICAFDEAPLDYILPENLPEALGVRDAAIVARLASSRLLRPAVDARILTAMPPPPKALPPASARLFADLVMKNANDLAQLCRLTAILINHKAILATTSGALLTDIVAWCGDQALLLRLRDTQFPAFVNFYVLSAVSRELLDLYATKVKAHLIGVLPPAYRQRLILRLAPEDLIEPLVFAPGDPDETCFLRYVAMSQEYSNVEN